MENNNSTFDMVVISTSLYQNYDKWIDVENIKNILNTNTNSLCLRIKSAYPDLPEKNIQTIALSYLIYTMYYVYSYKK